VERKTCTDTGGNTHVLIVAHVQTLVERKTCTDTGGNTHVLIMVKTSTFADIGGKKDMY
jgi:hypothetical protein